MSLLGIDMSQSIQSIERFILNPSSILELSLKEIEKNICLGSFFEIFGDIGERCPSVLVTILRVLQPRAIFFAYFYVSYSYLSMKEHKILNNIIKVERVP